MPLTDYLRAPEPELVIQVMQQDQPLLETDGGLFDGLSAKGIDSAVALGKLVALIRDVPWAVRIVGSMVLWPPPEARPATKAEWAELPEDSPWSTGPWLEELSDEVRDDLAGLPDDRFGVLAERWAGIEEFHGAVSPEAAGQLIAAFTGLAQRAAAAGDHLYCWTCL
jgi:hypothetical protein